MACLPTPTIQEEKQANDRYIEYIIEKAEYFYKEAAENGGWKSAFELSETYKRFGLNEKAKQYFELAVLNFKPKEDDKELAVSVLSKMGETYLIDYHDEVKAEKCFSRALELDVNDYEANKGLGVIYYVNHKYTQAIPLFNKALETKKDDVEILTWIEKMNKME